MTILSAFGTRSVGGGQRWAGLLLESNAKHLTCCSQQLFDSHTDWVTSIAWSPDSTKVCPAPLRNVLFVACADVHACKVCSGCGDGVVRVFDIERPLDGPLLLRGHTDWVESVDWSADGTWLASCAFEKDGTVRVWDAGSGQAVHILSGHDDRVHTVCFHPRGGTLASGGADKTIFFWDISSGEVSRVISKTACTMIPRVLLCLTANCGC